MDLFTTSAPRPGTSPEVTGYPSLFPITTGVRNGNGVGGAEWAESLPNIVSFSGGQTSGYMLRRLLDAGMKCQVIFCNTGKEHDRTLDFVHDVETKWGVPVTWLEYCRLQARDIDPLQVPEGRKRQNLARQAKADEGAHWFRVVRWETAARRFDKWTPFDEMLDWVSALPNVRGRWCSSMLKIRTMRRYLDAQGIDWINDYVGIRKDEEHRKHEVLVNAPDKHLNALFPLCDAGTTKRDVDAWWEEHPFRLNIPNHMGNCDLCFLKSRWKRLAAAKAEPEAAQWWADWERKFATKGVTGDGARFKAGESYEGLILDAAQPELALDMSEADVPCSCAVGGYRMADDDEDEMPLAGGGGAERFGDVLPATEATDNR